MPVEHIDIDRYRERDGWLCILSAAASRRKCRPVVRIPPQPGPSKKGGVEGSKPPTLLTFSIVVSLSTRSENMKRANTIASILLFSLSFFSLSLCVKRNKSDGNVFSNGNRRSVVDTKAARYCSA